jgi:hypothetical protein
MSKPSGNIFQDRQAALPGIAPALMAVLNFLKMSIA